MSVSLVRWIGRRGLVDDDVQSVALPPLHSALQVFCAVVVIWFSVVGCDARFSVADVEAAPTSSSPLTATGTDWRTSVFHLSLALRADSADGGGRDLTPASPQLCFGFATDSDDAICEVSASAAAAGTSTAFHGAGFRFLALETGCGGRQQDENVLRLAAELGDWIGFSRGKGGPKFLCIYGSHITTAVGTSVRQFNACWTHMSVQSASVQDHNYYIRRTHLCLQLQNFISSVS